MFTAHIHPRGFANECTVITAASASTMTELLRQCEDIQPLPARDRARHTAYVTRWAAEPNGGSQRTITAEEAAEELAEYGRIE